MNEEPLTLERARALFDAGNAADAYRVLAAVCAAGPDPLARTGALAAAVALLGDCARSFGDATLAAKLDALRSNPEDPRALHGVAYDLYEQGQYAAGGALLFRANALAPGQIPIVTELAGCLERQLRYGEAALVVDVSGLAVSDPVCAYLSGFGWMMTGAVDTARERVASMARAADPQVVFLREALAGMVARADAVRAAGIALDENSLVAWHAVLNGAALLHASPHGYPDPMRGRYAYVSDSPGLEREGLERLRALLAARGALPPRIVAAPDRASEILATAAAGIFGVPRAAWRAGDGAPGLVVAWSLEAAGDPDFLRSMHEQRPGQVLFAHASSWTDPFVYSPDVTTFLHQQATNPWTGGALRVDPATRAVTPAEPDTRSSDAIAAEILAAPIADPSATPIDEVIAVLRALDSAPPAYHGGLARAAGKRLHQRAGGPVPSNRFV